MTDPLPWQLSETDVPARGLDLNRSATAEECAELARQIDVLACRRLSIQGRITAEKGNRYHLLGTLEADLTQECIVSLDSIETKVRSKLNVYFGPPANDRNATKPEDEDFDPFAEADDETIEHGVLPLGRVVFEELVTRIDRYPRTAGLDFDWKDPTSEERPPSPFARLEALKNKKKDN
jgi:uncharacterized metal-binding protein YceD (DUF177 family)